MFDTYDEYKSRKNLKKHTFRNSNSIRESLKENRKKIYKDFEPKDKNFEVYQTQENKKFINQVLDKLPVIENDHYQSTKILPYSLNKQKRWLLPELIDSMEGFKISTTNQKSIKKNNLVKTIEFIEDVDKDTTKNSLEAACTCDTVKTQFRYKNGNRYLLRSKSKKNVCEKEKGKKIEQPKVVFAFDNGYTQRFNRRQINNSYKKNVYEKKNFSFRARIEQIDRIKDEIEEEKRLVKIENEKHNESNVDQNNRPKYVYYIIKRKLLPKIREKVYNFEFIYGHKSFTDKESIRKVLLKSLLKNTSPALLIKSRYVQNKSLICTICFGNYSCLLSLHQCQHSACHNCWISYIKTAIQGFMLNNGTIVKPISCLFENCNTVLGLDFLSNLLKSQTIEDYKKFYCESQLIRSSKYSFCPSNDCGKILVKSLSQSTSICNCNYMMCNLCQQELHYPMNCKDYQSYKIKFSNYDPKFITQGKFCPKCSRFIEKNGGCNHMK